MIWNDVRAIAGLAPPNCRHGRSCASAAPPLRRRRRRMRGVPARAPLGAISSWPAIGPHTGLPATIESAVRSGNRAADFVIAAMNGGGSMTCTAIPLARRDSRPAPTPRRSTARSRGATAALIACQRSDGHWVFELEADATIPAEYVLFRHYLDEPLDAGAGAEDSPSICAASQGAHGGWPLFQDGDFDMSATVKAYFALKMIGDRARCAAHGAGARGDAGARRRRRSPTSSPACCWRCSAIMTWTSVPVMPVEIMLLPRWFPFHITKMSYWGRTVLVPLLVIQALKPRAAKPARRRHRRTVSRKARATSGRRNARRIRMPAGSPSSAPSMRSCARPSRGSPPRCADARLRARSPS